MSIKKQASIKSQFSRHVNFCKNISKDTKMSALQIRLERIKILYTDFIINQADIGEDGSQQSEMSMEIEKLFFFCKNEYSKGITSRYLQKVFNAQNQEEPGGFLVENSGSNIHSLSSTHTNEQSRRLSSDSSGNHEHHLFMEDSSHRTQVDSNVMNSSEQFSQISVSRTNLEHFSNQDHQSMNVRHSPEQIDQKLYTDRTIGTHSENVEQYNLVIEETATFQNEHQVKQTSIIGSRAFGSLITANRFHKSSESDTSQDKFCIFGETSKEAFGYNIHCFRNQQSSRIMQPMSKSLLLSSISNHLVSVSKFRAMSSSSWSSRILRKFEHFLRVSINGLQHVCFSCRKCCFINLNLDIKFRADVVASLVEFRVQNLKSFNVHRKSLIFLLLESNHIFRCILANQEYDTKFKIWLRAINHYLKSQFLHTIGIWHWLNMHLFKVIDLEQKFCHNNWPRELNFHQKNFIYFIAFDTGQIQDTRQRSWLRKFGPTPHYGQRILCEQERQSNSISTNSAVKDTPSNNIIFALANSHNFRPKYYGSISRFRQKSTKEQIFWSNVRFCVIGTNLRSTKSDFIFGEVKPLNDLGQVNAQELREALRNWIRYIQLLVFRDEVERCKTGDELLMKSRLRKLRPFLDEHGILRVDGRIKKSPSPFKSKHPIILPKDNHFTKLILEQAHNCTLHGGPTLMSTFLTDYWIFGRTDQINRTINHCVTCFPYRCKPTEQIMADLPVNRVTGHRAFLHSGVDFAGPFITKTYTGRSRGIHANPTVKSYIAIFVCLATKAVHIDLVSSSDSGAFIACFKRFVARRGKCSDMYSDNGKNFVKSNRELREHLKNLMKDPNLQTFLAHDGTTWHFNPPAGPSFGGLWEAGVKSIKYHLKRLLGNNTFTFEELTTLLYQIEACLNSRPLCAISNDVNDVSYLTPGHFLIGESPIAVPEVSLLDANISRLSRWKLIQRLYQEFWKLWYSEYLSRLQQRPKWLKNKENVKVGQLVLLKKEDVPPAKWPVARILKVYPGEDGMVRVVKLEKFKVSIKPPIPNDFKKYIAKLKAHKSTFKRPISKVSVLPIEDNENLIESLN